MRPREMTPTSKLLVVDDSHSILELIPRLLDGTEFLVTTACGAKEALATFSSQPFALVLTDVVMPGMDGNELARRLQTLKPELPVVFMTGYSEHIRPGLYLIKPFTREKLVETLRAAVRPSPTGCDTPCSKAASAG